MSHGSAGANVQFRMQMVETIFPTGKMPFYKAYSHTMNNTNRFSGEGTRYSMFAFGTSSKLS